MTYVIIGLIILAIVITFLYVKNKNEYLILNSFPYGIRKTYIQPSTILNGCRFTNNPGPISLGMY